MTQAKQGKSKKAAIERIFEVAQDLSPEDRRQLAQAGVVIPMIASADDIHESVFDYRCRFCGGTALEFVGKVFLNASGEFQEQPDPLVPLDMQPFRQPKIEPQRINRRHPHCQSCGVPIHVIYGRLDPKYVRATGEVVNLTRDDDRARTELEPDVQVEGKVQSGDLIGS